MAGAKKPSKNNPDAKAGTQKVNLVLSGDCEKCNNKCNSGTKYLARIHAGKAGIGVVCKK